MNKKNYDLIFISLKHLELDKVVLWPVMWPVMWLLLQDVDNLTQIHTILKDAIRDYCEKR